MASFSSQKERPTHTKVCVIHFLRPHQQLSLFYGLSKPAPRPSSHLKELGPSPIHPHVTAHLLAPKGYTPAQPSVTPNTHTVHCGPLTAVGVTAVPLLAWPRFLLSSSFTGSFTRTPWYGRGGAGACSGAVAVESNVTGTCGPSQTNPKPR